MEQHRAYLGEMTLPWLTTDFGLSMFGKTIESARMGYRELMAQTLHASEERLFDDTHPDDPRVLGTDRFIASLHEVARYFARSPSSLSELLTRYRR
jgi:hypothetical protein